MVQRKVPPKLLLGIQADNKFEKPRFGRNLRPSSPKTQDGLTKKMKKSRSIITKKSDPDNLLQFRNEVSLPGKPPPPPSEASTPEKQFPVRRSESSPNYMKSTSSSDARKERSQVSPQTTTTPPPTTTTMKEKCSKSSSGSGHKSAKTLVVVTKTTSLKLGRTLTKSPSFKPARSSSSSTKNKLPQVVLQRATCSSTLKESKFPSYLQLSHGATESEGTSAMKVCPYTYCSLNGHRHTHHHPPLKSFISAIRRTLKTQKSTKLGCLSPGRPRPDGEKGGIGNKHSMILDDDKPATIQEIDRPPLIDAAAEEPNSSITDWQEEEMEFDEGVDKNIAEVISSEEVQLAEEWRQHDHSDSSDVEATDKAEEDGSGPENCDMEWEEEEEEEEGQHSAPSAADDDGQNVEHKSPSDGDYDLHLLGEYSFGWFNDISSCKFDEIPNHEEISEEEEEEEEEEERASDSSSQKNWGRIGYYADEEFENYTTYPLCSSPFEEVKKSSGEETDEEKSELDYYSEGTSITLAAIEEPVEEDQSEAETKRAVQIGEDGSTGCEISHGDSADHLHNYDTYEEEEEEEEDYRSSDNSEGFHQKFETDGEEMGVVESLIDDKIGNSEANQTLHPADESLDARATTNEDLTDETWAHSFFDKKSPSDNIVEDEFGLNHVIQSQNKTDEEEDDTDGMEVSSSGVPGVSSADTALKMVPPFVRGVRMPDEEQSSNIKLRITKCIRSEEEELEDARKFNPREPNYLPVKPDPEAEKVDLKHQMMEERKDSQEWMVDYALRQTVDKLATAAARKKKVALLVEAFEKVTPTIPKKIYQQSHLSSHTPSASFAHHTRRFFVQACS